MKHLLNYAAAAVIGSSLLLASCGDDIIDPVPVTPTNEAPTLMVENPDMSMMGTSITRTDLPVDTRVPFSLVGEDADGNLQALTVQRNGSNVQIPTSNVFLDGSPLSNNPLLLVDADTMGFRKSLELRGPTSNGDTVMYTIILNDNGLSGASREEASITITLISEDPATPLGQSFTNREFYNRSDPSAGRPGAIDLDTGDAVPSSNNTESELQDQGNAGGDWLRQVAPENSDTQLYIAPDDTDWDSIVSVEALLDVFDASGDAVSLSPPLQDGDILIVTRTDATTGSKFYAVQFTQVVNESGTTNDKYVVNIKQN